MFQPAIARLFMSMHTILLGYGEDWCIPLRMQAQRYYVGGSEVIASVADAEVEELS